MKGTEIIWLFVAAAAAVLLISTGQYGKLIGAMAAAGVTAYFAGKKGRSQVAWGSAGLCFGIVPLIVLAFKEPIRPPAGVAREGL